MICTTIKKQGLHEESNSSSLWEKSFSFEKRRYYLISKSLPDFHPKAKFAYQFVSFSRVSIYYDRLLTINITGSCNTGKSALLAKMCMNEFIEVYQPTIGVTFNTTRIVDFDHKTTFNLQLWDLSYDIIKFVNLF